MDHFNNDDSHRGSFFVTSQTDHEVPSPGPSRRRRMRHRWSRSGAELRASSSGSSQVVQNNLDADPFVPRTPAKKKSSTFVRSNRAGSILPAPIEQSYIHGEDLFGRNPIGLSSEALGHLIEDDERSVEFDIDEQQDQQVDNLNQRRDRLREALAQISSRRAEMARRPFDASQCSSAIIYAQESSDSSRLRYLPLGAAPAGSWRESSQSDANFRVLPNFLLPLDTTKPSSAIKKSPWPPHELPLEIFDLITDHLSRDDIKSMRLVNKEFEKKVSSALFNTSVVPFNTEIYDMINDDTKSGARSSCLQSTAMASGEAKAWMHHESPTDTAPVGLSWQNAREDVGGKVYKGHGLRVFQGFGPHIKRFGMSFEVAEDQLSETPVKEELDHFESYHGPYDWPQQQYTRFANLAGLERAADETLRMKAAFGNLHKVQDLGLSMDSGLGWLNGPDKSIRACVFQQPSPMFGQSRPDRHVEEVDNFWAALQASRQSLGIANLRETTLVRRVFDSSVTELHGIKGTRYSDTNMWPLAPVSSVTGTLSGEEQALTEQPQDGVYFTTCNHSDFSDQCMYDKSALVPSNLRKEQKEWLLETEWAQRAFLESYMLAIIDNASLSSNIKTLTLAKVSSGFLALLAREAFWDALSCLATVSIHVSADWRSIERDNAGIAQTCPQNPSETVRLYHELILKDRICPKSSITRLTIGWAGGGEHASGIFARNAHVLPAPITPLEQSTAALASGVLEFPSVEHLALNNCWITPPVLESLVKCHADKRLKSLTLDSVSLTAHPRFPIVGQQQGAPGLIPHQQQLFHAWQQQVTVQQTASQNAAQMMPQNHIAGTIPLWPWHGNAHGNTTANIPINVPLNVAQHPGLNFPHNNMQHHAIAPFHWTFDHREGSWPDVLNKISPGTTFSDFLAQTCNSAVEPPQQEGSTLQSVEFISCGYVKLHNNTWFDQVAIEANSEYPYSPWFRTRQTGLAPAMMTAHDRFLGRIVQHIPQRELDSMLFAWELIEGWRDVFRAEESQYDGLLVGGTGRFSGRITRHKNRSCAA